MKSMNCISTTGRMPMWAAPAAAPTIPASLIGVSMTRASPKRSASPSVTLNAPPYAPMSSPMQKTFGSRSISSESPCRIASRKVDSAISALPALRGVVRPPSLGTLVLLDRLRAPLAVPERHLGGRLGENAGQRIGALGRRRALGFVGRGIHLGGDAGVDRG